MTTLHDFSAIDIHGRPYPLATYAGQVVLIVNVASECGFTPQYRGLEALYRRYTARGFAILGFPCNQFGGQEPGDEAAIAQFCASRYDASFPLFAKIEVNGPQAHPLYRWLAHEKPGLLGTRRIKWNFTKFLCGANGHVIARYAPFVKPGSIARDIEKVLPHER